MTRPTRTFPRELDDMDRWVWDNDNPAKHHGWLDLRSFPGMAVVQGAGRRRRIASTPTSPSSALRRPSKTASARIVGPRRSANRPAPLVDVVAWEMKAEVRRPVMVDEVDEGGRRKIAGDRFHTILAVQFDDSLHIDPNSTDRPSSISSRSSTTWAPRGH